jgi:3-hydroxyisobutyrate dehydrogenase-like beta-hydroxyacid dehydrogenase
MGGPMAGHLLAAGHDLTVFNRTPGKADALVVKGAKQGSLAEVAHTCDLIFLCVTRSEDVRACLEQMADAKAGTLFVDHSTIAPMATVEIYQLLTARGHRFVDAPITGGSMGAQKGQLTIFLGGTEEDCEEVLQVITAYAKRAERVGGPGAGQKAKMVNQIAVAGALLALCESLSFAKKAGLDLAQIRELVGAGAAGSWAFDNYGPKILARDWTPGFTILNQRKDFEYCKEAAESYGAAIPGTRLVDDLLAKLEAEGHGGWTTAALFEQMLEMTG